MPEYEVVFLMEMVMGNNQPYLQEFYARLGAQQYAFIVTDPVSLQTKGSDYPFGEENDVWNARVSEPLWCHYEPVLKLDTADVWVLQPRQHGCN